MIFCGIDVEAESLEKALETWHESEDCPGEVMLLDHRYPDMDEWELSDVTDPNGNILWSESDNVD
jgi:CheY-like chemotaxis protein